MAATLITVTHQFTNPDQSPGSGIIAFRLSARITNGGQSYAPQVPIHASLDGSGLLSQLVPANNDPATNPTDSFYVVTFFLNGDSGDEQEITVPYNAPGGTIDLGILLPAQQGA
jgi:hypothetical protein